MGKCRVILFKMDFKLHKINENALGGLAIQKEVIATFKSGKGTGEMNILIMNFADHQFKDQ